MNVKTELSHWVLIATMFGLSAISWGSVPGGSGKLFSLLLIPLVTVGIYLLFLFVPRFDPFGRGSLQSSMGYQVTRLAVTAFLAAMHLLAVLDASGAVGTEYTVLLVMLVLSGVLLIVLGNAMQNIRPNGLIGIRTPWTLSDEHTWEKTHQHGRRIFTFVGLVFVVCGFVGSVGAMWFSVGVLIVASVELFAYSYLVSRAG